MDSQKMQPHLCLTTDQITPIVIVVGDPARAEALAKLCTTYKEIAYNREYRTFQCVQEGETFTVTSHGIGSAGAAICFEELIKLGAKAIIRAGTAGSLQPSVLKRGDIVVCHSAAKEDGVSVKYVPSGFPCIADPSTYQSILATASQLQIPVHSGSTLTCDLFYTSPVLPGCLETYAKAGIDIVEMEVSTLFTICRVRKVKAAAICCVDGCPLQWDEGEYGPTMEEVVKAKASMIKLAMSTAVKLTKEAKVNKA